MQVHRASGAVAKPTSGDAEMRAKVVGIEPGQPGELGTPAVGRHITRSYHEAEAEADVHTG